MDLLYKRYASPFSFMDLMISRGNFCDTIEQIEHDEFEKNAWEYWLHKVYEQSWTDYYEEINSDKNVDENTNFTQEELETTINESIDILENFKPEV